MIESFAPSITVSANSDKLASSHPRHRVWQLHIDDAERFIKSRQHRKARQKLRAALREALHFGENDERLATTLVNLVASEVELNDGELSNDQTLALANDAVRVNKICYGDNNEKTARCLLNVGVLLEYHRLFGEANAALAEAIEILRCHNEKTSAVNRLLCHTLYNRAALLWSHQAIGIEPAEILKLAEEAYALGESLYGQQDQLVGTIKGLIDDIKLAEDISDYATSDDNDLSDDDVDLSQSGSRMFLPEDSIPAQLAAAGENLPETLRTSIIGLGHEIIPELIAILENDALAMHDAPGSGHVPIHAAELLSDLGAIESAEPMLRVLSRCDWLDILHSALTHALESFGAAVLEPGLKSYTVAENQDQREGVAVVLAGIGVRDPRILSILLEVFRENVELGAGLLAKYGDPVALPQLSAALDACGLDAEGGLFANQDVIEIADAIAVLDGTLTSSQENLLESVHRAGDTWRKAFLSLAGISRKRS